MTSPDLTHAERRPAPELDDATRLTEQVPLDDATRLAPRVAPPPGATRDPAPLPPLPPVPFVPEPPRAATVPQQRVPPVPEPPPGVPLPAPPAPPSHTVLARHVVGAAPGQVRLLDRPAGVTAEATRLEHDRQVLPELEELPPARPLYRRPAFVVSAAVAAVAVLTCVALVVVQQVTRRPPAVESLTLQDVGDYYLLEWDGPDVAYDLVLTTADGADPGDVSSLVRGREAWVPRTSAHVTADSCLVVRASEVAADHPFTVDAADLAAQGGAMVCVADADA